MFNRMNFKDFEALWQGNKSIVEEVRFIPRLAEGVFEIERVEVLGTFSGDVVVHGSYHCGTGAVTFTFCVEGLGAIVRYCVGGNMHGNAGRYHRHEMRGPDDIRQNLPYAVARPDLIGLTAKQVWEVVCQESNISHTDTFFDPEPLCE